MGPSRISLVFFVTNAAGLEFNFGEDTDITDSPHLLANHHPVP